MEDNDFYDLIYAQWARTTGAEDRYWMPVEYEDPSGRNYIFAVGEDESRKQIASGLKTEDADFITAIHGCLPDLIRKLRGALDEADRLDEEKDELIGRVAELERDTDRLAGQVLAYSERIKELEDSELDARSFIELLANENKNLEKELDNG
jgi:chromosome segregation ATPase